LTESTGAYVYLDNAATTPVRPEVREAMRPYLAERFGNPSSAHRIGREARAGVEEARRRVADALGCDPREVFFTSGGTEADNLAVLGTALHARDAGRPWGVAVSAIEHPAVLAAAEWIEHLGGTRRVLPVDERGVLDAAALSDALSGGVAVVSAMWVNNEVGTIQAVDTIGRACRDAGVAFHTDAVQAVGKIPCRVADTHCTFLALSGHKIGAPKGVGALVVRDRTILDSLLHGGGQQFGVRPGTENTAGIAGLGCAVELAVRDQAETAAHLAGLRDAFEAALTERIPGVVVNGRRARRAPHISNVAIPGLDAGEALMHLDLAGVACSTGSACKTGSTEPSRVLRALGVGEEPARRSLRFSFYRQNTAAEVATAIEALVAVVQTLQGVETS